MDKMIIIEKGEVIDYQTMIEEVVGMFMAISMPCYKEYAELTEEQKNKTGRSHDAKSRAWFAAESDYELIIKKKRR